nr:MAG TPA: hypothetical protein [Bacteriophage sp.]
MLFNLRGTPHHRLHQSPIHYMSIVLYRASPVTKCDISHIFCLFRLSDRTPVT